MRAKEGREGREGSEQALLDAGLALCATVKNLIIGAISTEELNTLKGQAATLEQALHDAGAAPPGGGAGAVPELTDVKPNAGPDGTEVVVSGSNFGESGMAAKVKFGTEEAMVVAWGDTAITVAAVQGINLPDELVVVSVQRQDGQTTSPSPEGGFTFTAGEVGGGATRSGKKR